MCVITFMTMLPVCCLLITEMEERGVCGPGRTRGHSLSHHLCRFPGRHHERVDVTLSRPHPPNHQHPTPLDHIQPVDFSLICR